MTKLTDAEYSARRRAYRERPEVKAYQRAYQQRPEVKANQRANYAKTKADLAEFRAWKLAHSK